MSSINGISGSNYAVAPIALTRFSGHGNGGADRDGDHGGSGVSAAARRGGLFSSAIVQALAQIGVSAAASPANASAVGAASSTQDAASNGTSSSTQDAALKTFMHDLFAALHSLSGGQSNAAGASQTASNAGTDSDGVSDGSGTPGAAEAVKGRGRHGGGLSTIENNLQTLIQQLSSSSTTTAAASSNSALSSLQSDYQNLLGSVGASGNQASLASFLGAIAGNLQGSNPGLNISTKV